MADNEGKEPEAREEEQPLVEPEMKVELSEAEQKVAEEMAQVANVANRLVQGDTRYGRLVASMLASRQLYAMCLYELERLVDDTDFKKATELEDQPPLAIGKTLPDQQAMMLKEILINSAAVQAQQPFDEQQLFAGMVNTVFPWMRDVVALHNQMQAEQRQQEFKKAEEKRIASKVSFNVQFFSEDESDECFHLHRGKPVVLVGWKPAVLWLRDFILENAIKENTNIEQVLCLNSGGKPKHSDSRIWYVPKNDWNDVAETTTAFQRLYQQNIMDNLIAPVDLLFVDDLIHAKKGLSVSSPPTIANESQKKFRRWAEKAGCLLVGCMTYDRQLKPNELNLPDYETLRMHNILRGVVAEKGNVDNQEWYKIKVGRFEVDRVPAAEVEAYQQSNIIKP